MFGACCEEESSQAALTLSQELQFAQKNFMFFVEGAREGSCTQAATLTLLDESYCSMRLIGHCGKN